MPNLTIPFNVPFDATTAFNKILTASFDATKLFSGAYASRVRAHFKENYHAGEVILTGACTRALELAALLLELKPGDEVIVPAYTYVSSANAFELFGAKVIFCDSLPDSPNMDIRHLEKLITPKTKAVVAVHYAGISVDMDKLVRMVREHGLFLIEDAAQGVHAFYKNKPLGSFGDLAVLSFHETKNVTCGQGGALLINNPKFTDRAIVLKNVGTNRHRFFLGLEDKYTWIDSGSVFNLPELCCAYLYPQLANVAAITQKRVQLWQQYYDALLPLAENGHFTLPTLHKYNKHNGHIFYICLKSKNERDQVLQYLKKGGVTATFHYAGLHQSPYYTQKYGEQPPLPNAEKYADQLLRLPLYATLTSTEQEYVLQLLKKYFDRPKRHIRPEPVLREKTVVSG
ncbi:MAG: dTDP-4-amino-4,6-dideoxygalactose transaminase [Saprospiraceae bacterium]